MSAYGLPGVVGILVISLSSDSPLNSCGILSKDVILTLNGQRTDDLNQLLARFKSLPPGQEFSITVMRNQQPQTFKMKVPACDDPPRQAANSSVGFSLSFPGDFPFFLV